MLYQKLLMGERPYFACFGKMFAFEEHRHSEIEINYCLKGSYEIIVDKTPYKVNEGEFIFIGSMTPHEVPASSSNDCLNLTLEVGPMLLSGYFEALSAKKPENPIFNFSQNARLTALVKEIASLYQTPKEFSELTIRGDVFKICAIIMEQIVSVNSDAHTSKTLRSVANIENALDLIHSHYANDLTIEEVAAYCSYSKSNFCKIFKNITGETFHSLLSKRRVSVACNLLKQTDLPLEAIATQTGFADSKSLCRVFKNILGCSPGSYRKNKD